MNPKTADETATRVIEAPKPAGMKPETAAKPTQEMRFRERALDAASEIISTDRDATYGDSTECFERIAAMWTARELHITNRIYTVHDVAQMMILTKAARLAFNPKHGDSLIDQIGYAALDAEHAHNLK